jgi:integrase
LCPLTTGLADDLTDRRGRTGRPYALRHAAVSTWLNAGGPSTHVAEWAGHSLAVLLQIYAECLVGQEEEEEARADGSTRLGGPDA